MDPIISLHKSRTLHYQYIFNLLQRFKINLRLFDLRPSSSYLHRHLLSSKNIFFSIESLNLDSLSLLLNEKELSRLRRYCIIIAYDHTTTKQAKLLRDLLHAIKCKEVHMLDSINEFMNQYTFLCSDFRELKIKDFPNEIIPQFLYLGSQEHAHNYDIIDVLRITHILNVTKNAPNIFPGINYLRLHVEDSESEKISLYFQKAFEFIDNALDENFKGASNVVLVHCAQGVSRSATIVIMYLMRSAKISLKEAKAFVKKQRDIIEPNEGFCKQLKEFDRKERRFIRRRSAIIPDYEVSKEIDKKFDKIAVRSLRRNGRKSWKSCESRNLLRFQ
jgi:protein-tyrosine phosphatase